MLAALIEKRPLYMITFSTSSQAVRRTGAKSNKIDYILLLPTLGATVSAVGEQRRGV